MSDPLRPAAPFLGSDYAAFCRDAAVRACLSPNQEAASINPWFIAAALWYELNRERAATAAEYDREIARLIVGQSLPSVPPQPEPQPMFDFLGRKLIPSPGATVDGITVIGTDLGPFRYADAPPPAPRAADADTPLLVTVSRG